LQQQQQQHCCCCSQLKSICRVNMSPGFCSYGTV
jgi:hypothetical protein